MGEAAVITVTARFRARDADALVPLLQALADHSRSEPGCLAYDYYRSGDDFTSIEHWSDAKAEAAHNDTAFLRDSLKAILPLIDGSPAVTRWQRL